MTVQNTEGQSRPGEEIHGGDGFTMIAAKSQPALRWIRILIRTPHPARNRSFRDVETQLEHLPVNAGRSPSWVFCGHTEDQLAHFPADWFSSQRLLPARDPTPVQPKTCTMPPDDGLRGN